MQDADNELILFFFSVFTAPKFFFGYSLAWHLPFFNTHMPL